MPIARIHVVKGAFPDHALGDALIALSRFYAQTLYPEADPVPIERVRLFVDAVEPALWAAGGLLGSEGGSPAPFFTCIVLAGRPIAQHHELLAGFTAILARHLDCDAAAIRGQIIPVEPDNWGIGGRPASVLRQAEIAARAAS